MPTASPAPRRRAASAGALADAVRALGNEVSRLHLRLVALLEALHGPGAFSYGGRAILRDLVELGPRTVPELAAMRPVTRQYVQLLVDDLRARGLVALADNPAHRRSKLVRVTARGRGELGRMLAREAEAMRGAAADLTARELRAAADVLRRVREAAEGLAVFAPAARRARPRRRAGGTRAEP